jgi:hypothetical protein
MKHIKHERLQTSGNITEECVQSIYLEKNYVMPNKYWDGKKSVKWLDTDGTK